MSTVETFGLLIFTNIKNWIFRWIRICDLHRCLRRIILHHVDIIPYLALIPPSSGLYEVKSDLHFAIWSRGRVIQFDLQLTSDWEELTSQYNPHHSRDHRHSWLTLPLWDAQVYHHWSAQHFCLYHNVQLNLKPLRPLLLAMSLLLYFTQTTEPSSCNKSVALSSDSATAIDHHVSQNKTKKTISYSILSHSSVPINPPSTTILNIQKPY